MSAPDSPLKHYLWPFFVLMFFVLSISVAAVPEVAASENAGHKAENRQQKRLQAHKPSDKSEDTAQQRLRLLLPEATEISSPEGDFGIRTIKGNQLGGNNVHSVLKRNIESAYRLKPKEQN